MADGEFAVMISVDRGGGRTEDVRVGTAVRSGEGFVVRFGEMRMKAAGAATQSSGASFTPPPWQAQAESRGAPAPFRGDAGGGLTLPNYGRSKGQPVVGASLGDLEYYAAGCKRTLADGAKARWHDKERVLLAAIEAEIIRQRGMPPMSSESAPPSFGASYGASYGNDERPPPVDDDVPF